MYPQCYVLEQKYENSTKHLTENCHFYSHEILQYFTLACFRNDIANFVGTHTYFLHFFSLISNVLVTIHEYAN